MLIAECRRELKGFFSFEGIDGSGKTTQIQLLSDLLKQHGIDVVLCREPGSTAIGESIRRILLDPDRNEMAPLTELLLYNASRTQLLSEVVIPALNNNKVVICDRFSDSTLAYQGFGRGLDRDIIEKLNKIVLKEFKPKLTFFLDLHIDEARRRNKKVLKDDRFEHEAHEFYQKILTGYRTLANQEPERFKIIDARGKPHNVHKKIITIIKDHGFFRH